jgi:hypothetical protein
MFSSDQILKIEKEISSKVDGKTLFDEFLEEDTVQMHLYIK